MTFRFFFRQTQVLGTTILIGSLAACTNIKHDGNGTPTAAAPAGVAATPAPKTPVAKTKENAAPASALDSQISGIHQQVAARQQYNEKLRTFVADKEKQLTTILASDRSAGPTVQEFDLRTSINSKLSEIDRESKAWQERIDAHKAVLSKAADDPHATDLQTEINQLSEQRAELLRQRVKLAALPDKLKP